MKTAQKPSKLDWYLHRLRAMGPSEIGQRFTRRVLRSRTERLIKECFHSECGGRRANAYPRISHGQLPTAYHEALADETKRISAGEWRLFGHVSVQLDMPPRWHHDPLADYTSEKSLPSSEINHRHLPDGADGRVLWELSRWSELTRLAQARSELNDLAAGALCVELLENWVQNNLPLQGINWTSPLEGAIRLINFAWIDALLHDLLDDAWNVRWNELCRAILPSHVRWLWLERSLGSSANNHLLGELVGLAVVLCRWPDLCNETTTIEVLRAEISRQVLLQFAPDGGNYEQALHYHWFALELAWHADLAFEAAGEGLAPAAKERLVRAGQYFVDVAETKEPWDFGDSDDAHVVPLFARIETKIPEFHEWAEGNQNSVAHWWPQSPVASSYSHSEHSPPNNAGWTHFRDTGISMYRDENWSLRFDHSPLGFAPMAAHGHLDALHLSIWYQGLAVIIDPGTGCYYHDEAVRNYLASWQAHNGPLFDTSNDQDKPQRYGPFLWGDRHADPVLSETQSTGDVTASFRRSKGEIMRTVRRLDAGGWRIVDSVSDPATKMPISVKWQFAPEWTVNRPTSQSSVLTLSRDNISISMEVSRGTVFESRVDHSIGTPTAEDFYGICSHGFRTLSRSTCIAIRSDDYIETIFRTNKL